MTFFFFISRTLLIIFYTYVISPRDNVVNIGTNIFHQKRGGRKNLPPYFTNKPISIPSIYKQARLDFLHHFISAFWYTRYNIGTMSTYSTAYKIIIIGTAPITLSPNWYKLKYFIATFICNN